MCTRVKVTATLEDESIHVEDFGTPPALVYAVEGEDPEPVARIAWHAYIRRHPACSIDLQLQPALPGWRLSQVRNSVVWLLRKMVEIRDSRRNPVPGRSLAARWQPFHPILWSSDPDHRCTYVNEAWVRYSGHAGQDDLDRSWESAIHPEDRAKVTTAYREASLARKRYEADYRLRRANGRYSWVHSEGAPRFSIAGEFLGFVGVTFGISRPTTLNQVSERREQKEQNE